MKYAHVYLPDDDQGPHVPLCEACIAADGHETTDGWDKFLFRCACCGHETPGNDVEASRYGPSRTMLSIGWTSP